MRPRAGSRAAAAAGATTATRASGSATGRRRVDAAAARRLLERRRVARLEPPDQLGLCIGQLESLEARALVVEGAGKELHQPRDKLLLGPFRHYRYFTRVFGSRQTGALPQLDQSWGLTPGWGRCPNWTSPRV